jgi:hypothetical protein
MDGSNLFPELTPNRIPNPGCDKAGFVVRGQTRPA